MKDLKLVMDFSSSHGIDIGTAFELGQRLGYRMPKYISVYAVEVKDNSTFAEECTPEVEERIPFITKQIIEGEKL